MLSRVAENLYWMARYVERAENIARLIDVTHHVELDMPDNSPPQWMPLISILADGEDFAKRHPGVIADEATVTQHIACDSANPNSIVSCLRMARENARSVREIVPSELWLQLNMLFLSVTNAAESGVDAITPQLLAEIRMGSHLFFGLLTDTMTRGEGYYFAQLGRFIERADKTSRIIDVKYFLLLPQEVEVGSPFDNRQWVAVLKSVSALEMFRQQRAFITPARVIDFLLRNELFPRSVHYCLRNIEFFFDKVMAIPADATENPIAVRLNKLKDEIRSTPAETILLNGLHQYIDKLQSDLNGLHEEIYRQFFDRKPGFSSTQVQKIG